ncbi:hypothetical protein CAL26_04965 [Bordetella genomosp. 9]|uniref:Uncharacterized protein n=1 Tax=Bordetella genomosp. 9 TaxID=1416803 RepID=A0A261RNY1_9BORD|nr:hypothetical protein [Bordetella genomosp. 9]OZI26675.1 hypothetical protein CAL26_04965 [Bordetella genomosp. 9]
MSKAAYKAMREAHALCPADLPHLDRMRWMADYVERAIIAQARAEMRAEQWVPVEKGEPHCEGQYVIRINKHGHIRLGQRVLNPDTLRHQWQVGGEVCKTVTHYHPIPPLTLSKE